MTVERMQLIINLFFTPMAAVAIYYKRNRCVLKVTTQLLKEYVFFFVGTLLLAKAAMIIPRYWLCWSARRYNMTSPVYTLGALIAAMLLPYIAEVFQQYMRLRSSSASDVGDECEK